MFGGAPPSSAYANHASYGDFTLHIDLLLFKCACQMLLMVTSHRPSLQVRKPNASYGDVTSTFSSSAYAKCFLWWRHIDPLFKCESQMLPMVTSHQSSLQVRMPNASYGDVKNRNQRERRVKQPSQSLSLAFSLHHDMVVIIGPSQDGYNVNWMCYVM